MFIYRLIEKLQTYDPYHIHYWNGVRAVIALIGLFTVNYFYAVENPYFYYFYVPMTCLSLEVLGGTVMEKNRLFMYGVFWSALAILLFGLCAHHPVLELIVIFVFSVFIYQHFIAYYQYPLISAATVLSLAAYSMNYHNIDFYMVWYHFGITIFAGTIVFAVLNLLPSKIYFLIWYRIFSQNLTLVLRLFQAQGDRQLAMKILASFPLQLRYARMPQQKRVNLLKLSARFHELVENLVAMVLFSEYFFENHQALQKNLSYLSHHVNQRTPCLLELFERSNATEELIYKIAKDWNTLCAPSS